MESRSARPSLQEGVHLLSPVMVNCNDLFVAGLVIEKPQTNLSGMEGRTPLELLRVVRAHSVSWLAPVFNSGVSIQPASTFARRLVCMLPKAFPLVENLQHTSIKTRPILRRTSLGLAIIGSPSDLGIQLRIASIWDSLQAPGWDVEPPMFIKVG